MDYIGRYQVGDRVPIMVQFSNRRGAPLEPLLAPICQVIRCLNGATLSNFSMPITDSVRTDGLFLAELLIPSTYAEGEDYLVVIEGSLDGRPVVYSQRFTVMPGGNPDAEVQAMGYWERPEAAELVMQLGSGKLTSGRNPSIPTQEY